MTQATVIAPASSVKTCAECPYFENHNEPEHLTDKKGQSFRNPRYGCGWCELFDQAAKEHHEMTRTCVLSGALEVEATDKPVISHELEGNLEFFPEVEFEELDAFPSEEIIDPADLPYSEYQIGSIVKVIDKAEDHTEWGVFEIVECKYNQTLYRHTESYLTEAAWYFRLASNDDASTINQSLWVREDELCHFEQSHLICTDPDLYF